MNDSTPGDEVRLDYIRKGGAEIIDRVVRIVQEMWRTPAKQWEKGLKVGIMVPLHKKGDRGEVNNFRGVCLLAMGSRIIATRAAKRLGVWAERVDILDDNQAGFRRGKSTANVVHVMVRLEEDVEDLRSRVLGVCRDLDQGEWPEARLLDLRKAYFRVNKPALWMLLNRYGLGENMIRVIKGLRESTREGPLGRVFYLPCPHQHLTSGSDEAGEGT